MVDRYYNHVSHSLLVTTTRALRKFVDEHGGVQVRVLDRILASLDVDDFEAAAKAFRAIHFGPYGFDDWCPPARFPNEDGEYVQVVFDSLTERWRRLFTTAIGEGSEEFRV